jgi:hypothetical protein
VLICAVPHGAGAWWSQRDREPGEVEQQIHRLMVWGLGLMAVLLVDHGVEKPSTI